MDTGYVFILVVIVVIIIVLCTPNKDTYKENKQIARRRILSRNWNTTGGLPGVKCIESALYYYNKCLTEWPDDKHGCLLTLKMELQECDS